MDIFGCYTDSTLFFYSNYCLLDTFTANEKEEDFDGVSVGSCLIRATEVDSSN